MFRKSDGTKGFSWTRMFDNTLPIRALINGPQEPEYLSPQQQDAVFSHQVSAHRNPYALSETASYAAGILEESSSRSVYKKLQKTGVVHQNGTIDTSKVDGSFTHSMASVPAVQQKQIVDLLFWWEEECQRLRKLEGEREELEGLVLKFGSESVYVMLLERVQEKLRARPSERVASVERDEDELMVSFRRGTLAPTQQQRGGDEKLPAYSA